MALHSMFVLFFSEEKSIYGIRLPEITHERLLHIISVQESLNYFHSQPCKYENFSNNSLATPGVCSVSLGIHYNTAPDHRIH